MVVLFNLHTYMYFFCILQMLHIFKSISSLFTVSIFIHLLLPPSILVVFYLSAVCGPTHVDESHNIM